MTREELMNLLESNNISSDIVHFENGVQDGYYVLKNYYRWEVFFRERGKDYNCLGFPSESNALDYIVQELVPTTK